MNLVKTLRRLGMFALLSGTLRLGGSGGGAASLTLLSASGSQTGGYSTTSTSFVELDSALRLTAIVPSGHSAWAAFIGTAITPSSNSLTIAIGVDGTATIGGGTGRSSLGNINASCSLTAGLVFAGDGNSHVFSPYWFAASGGSDVYIGGDTTSNGRPLFVLLVV